MYRAKAGTTYDEPPTAWERGEYTAKDLAKIRAMAKRDDVWALTTLANHLGFTKRDHRAGLVYARRAAALSSDGDTLQILADMTCAVHGVERAAPIYRRALRQGSFTAAFNLAISYRNAGNWRAATRWFRRAEKAGDISAPLEVARAELLGIGTRRRSAVAMRKLARLATSRSHTFPSDVDRIEAILLIADALLDGWPVRRDRPKGLTWLRRDAALGSSVARAKLQWEGVS